VDECSSAPRMIQARPEVGCDESMLLLLDDFLETSLVLLDGVESRDEFGVRKVWRRRRLWRGRWRVMLVLGLGGMNVRV
jgi:hypothetical protein